MTIELAIGVAIGYIPCKYLNHCHGLAAYLNLPQTLIILVCDSRYERRETRHQFFLLAHLGGFLMGLLVGTIFYPVISVTKRHRLVMWTFRIVAIPIAVVLLVVLIKNFYTSDPYAGKQFFSFDPGQP
jgi:hypothetical protein